MIDSREDNDAQRSLPLGHLLFIMVPLNVFLGQYHESLLHISVWFISLFSEHSSHNNGHRILVEHILYFFDYETLLGLSGYAALMLQVFSNKDVVEKDLRFFLWVA